MLCELCQYRDATMTCARVVENRRLELHLCADCAEAQGFLTGEEEGEQFGDVEPEIFEAPPVAPQAEEGKDEQRCPLCNLTREEFERDGVLGCAQCYETFADDLEVLLQQLHGSARHHGRRPRPRRVFMSSGEISDLQARLQRAIMEEDFERAAGLRDLLRQAKQGRSGSDAGK